MKIIVIALTASCIFLSVESQTIDDKHSIGIQSNIFLNDNLFTGSFIQPVFALRYGYSINRNLFLGPEISGTKTYWRSHNVRDTKFTTIAIGGFGRYTFLPDKRVSPFVEISLYYHNLHFVPSLDPVAANLVERRENSVSGYFAPGLSIKSKSRNMSLDIMYKFSPDYFINDKHSVLSYRLNIHF